MGGIAEQGKGTTGWFYGFSLHNIVNHKSDIVAAKTTSASVHDTKHVAEMAVPSINKLHAVKCYISKALTDDLFHKDITLITNSSFGVEN